MRKALLTTCLLLTIVSTAHGQRWVFEGHIASVNYESNYICEPWQENPKVGDPIRAEAFQLTTQFEGDSEIVSGIHMLWNIGGNWWGPIDDSWFASRSKPFVTFGGGIEFIDLEFTELVTAANVTHLDELTLVSAVAQINVVQSAHTDCIFPFDAVTISRIDAANDVTGDGLFTSADLVAVFQAGEYEDRIMFNSTWQTGDWNGDREFNSSDLVVAFAIGKYETAVAGAAVPEPNTQALLSIAFAAVGVRCRRINSRCDSAVA
ncbi:MAG: hypothetical protein KDB23_25415 [Planctomycetales bacterium]|nr:hypothetical protein [Planctomycetales bacterium]